jgi:hypothetical protein
MAESAVRIYIGGRRFGSVREKRIRALALKHFPMPTGKGNVSMLFNDAVNRMYNLDPETGEERGGIMMVADSGKKHPDKKA